MQQPEINVIRYALGRVSDIGRRTRHARSHAPLIRSSLHCRYPVLGSLFEHFDNDMLYGQSNTCQPE